jgi:hypothetical protein
MVYLLAFMSPFIIAILLFSVRQFRVGGGICIVFGFFAGFILGFFGWLLILIFAEIGGRLAMEIGRWEDYYRLVQQEQPAHRGAYPLRN